MHVHLRFTLCVAAFTAIFAACGGRNSGSPCDPGCSVHGACVTTSGTPTCACLPGYSGNGLDCVASQDSATTDGSTDAGTTTGNDVGPRTLYLHSSATGTDMVIFGDPNPTSGVTTLLTGTVDRNSTTRMYYGTYEVDAAGTGTFLVASSYTFPYQPELGVAGRDGAQRQDFATPVALALQIDTLVGNEVAVSVEGVDSGNSHTYTLYADVVANLDLSGATGIGDAYQLYNFGLLFSQVRIPAFGSLGMTQYIAHPGHFAGLVLGDYSVSVSSLIKPWATLSHTNLEDLPGETVNGTFVTKVDISGTGPMEGVMGFNLSGGTAALPITVVGTVDYGNITVSNGLANSGNYMVSVTAPTVATGLVPYSEATNIDIRNVLPVGP